MRKGTLYKWDQIQEEIVLLCVQWYISYPLTYSQLKITMRERGFQIDPNTINYLINEYSSLAFKRFKDTTQQRRGGWRVVQIPFRLKGRKKYLYRALDAQGQTLDFMISPHRNTKKAQAFFTETLSKDLKIKYQFDDKRQKNREKTTFELLVSIFIILVIFVSGSYAVSLLDSQINNQDKDSNQHNQLPNPNKNAPVQNYTALDSLLPSEKAFLDTISWAEGTLHPHGYRLLFGGEVVEDLSSHPEKCVPVVLAGEKTCSTAFGRYQILDLNANNMSFDPKNQDAWAINKLKNIGALQKIHQGNIEGAIATSCKIWSSLPCYKKDQKGYYNQPVKSMNSLLTKYQERLNLYQ